MASPQPVNSPTSPAASSFPDRTRSLEQDKEGDADVETPEIPIACRFVPTDQWLTTHVNPSWTVHAIKLHLLSKFLSPKAGFAERAQSPSSGRRDSITSSSNSEIIFSWQPDEHPDDPAGSHESLAQQLADQEKDVLGEQTRKKAEDMGLSFSLTSFSNGNLLENNPTLASYGVRAFELLEIQRTNHPVYLSRSTYLEPYYDSIIYILRVPLDNGNQRKVVRKKKENVGLDSLASMKLGEMWKKSWVVIRDGKMCMWKNRTDGFPQEVYDMDMLTSIRGAPEFPNLPPLGENVVTLRFRKPEEIVRDSASIASNSSKASDRDNTRIQVVLRSVDSACHDHFLRVIHRHTCRQKIPVSTFLSSESTSSRQSGPTASYSSTTASSPRSKKSRANCVPYPEWRERVLERSAREGRAWVLSSPHWKAKNPDPDYENDDSEVEWEDWKSDLDRERCNPRRRSEVDDLLSGRTYADSTLAVTRHHHHHLRTSNVTPALGRATSSIISSVSAGKHRVNPSRHLGFGMSASVSTSGSG